MIRYCLYLLFFIVVQFSAAASEYSPTTSSTSHAIPSFWEGKGEKINYPAKALEALSRGSVPANPAADANAQAKASESLKNASLLFIENKGQLIDTEGKLHPEILFSAKAGGAQVYVTANSIHYVFSKVERAEKSKSKEGKFNPRDRFDTDSIKSVSTHRFTISLEGANPTPELVKQEGNPYYENYYLSHCPNGIMAKSYQKFTLKNVYPNIDWVVYSNGKGLKYDFVLAKAADASRIELKVEDADAKVAKDGTLEMNTSLGKVVEDKPLSFQNNQEIETNFKALGNQTFGFETLNADPEQPITIDPSVEWATYFGGSGTEYDWSTITTDRAGNVYLTGETRSTDLPVAGAFQGTYGGGGVSIFYSGDAFLVKFSSTGSLLWATYYGGSLGDKSWNCMIDYEGNIIFLGNTFSVDFPVSAGAFQSVNAGGNDAFLVKMNNKGIRLWATYYGGNFRDRAYSGSVDYSGAIYMGGGTTSTNFPVSTGAFQSNQSGSGNCFIVKFDKNGNRKWATYYGGTGYDEIFYCSLDVAGNLFLTGATYSNNFPISSGAFQTNFPIGDMTGFLVKFNEDGNRLWSTFINDFNLSAVGCATDSEGNVYVCGTTAGITDLPVSATSFQQSNAYDPNDTTSVKVDAFLIKFSGSGNLLWATYYGGSSFDDGLSCATDASDNVYMSGWATSTNFPISSGAIQDTIGMNPFGRFQGDAFLVKFDKNGNRQWATFYGGSENDISQSVAIDDEGIIYLSGQTNSHDLLVTSGALQDTIRGLEDAFVVKILDTEANFKWTGNTSTDWATATNWSGGIVPSVEDDVIVPANAQRMPTISGNIEVRRLRNSGVITINDQLSVKGNLVTNGGYLGTGIINLSGNSRQIIAGNNVLNVGNLHITNTNAEVILHSPAAVKGELKLGAGAKLNLNHHQVTLLASYPTRVTATLNLTAGNAQLLNAENFICQIAYPKSSIASGGSWVQTAPPVQNLQVRNLHQRGNFPSIESYNAAIPASGSFYWFSNSFTTHPTNNGFYKPSDSTEAWPLGKGIRAWIRKVPADNGAFGYKGAPFTGNSFVINNLDYCTNNCAISDPNGLNLVGNPLAATINWDLLTRNHVEDAMYQYNHSQLIYATYIDGVGVNGGRKEIATGQGFFVHALQAGASITVPQTAVVPASTFAIFRSGTIEDLLRININLGDSSVDEMAIRLKDGATHNFDSRYDGRKMTGSGINIASIAEDGRRLSVDARPLTTGMIRIPLVMSRMNNLRNEELVFTGLESFNGKQVYLNHPSFDAPVQLTEGQRFTVSPAYATGLEVIINNSPEALEGQLSNTFSLYPNPATENLTVSGINSGTVVRVLSVQGKEISRQTLGAEGSLSVKALPQGLYFVEINGIKKTFVKQ